MKSTMCTFALILVLCALGSRDIVVSRPQEQQSKKRQETPREKFYRNGGKTTREKISAGENGELTTATIAENRDLKVYDQSGHFDCRFWAHAFRKDSATDKTSDSIKASLSKAREFIWQRWQSKRRGYIRLTFDSVDAVSTSHIFVEPDERGSWRVVWRIVRHFGEIDDLPAIRSVERIPSVKGQEKENNLYKLVFRDNNREIWQTL